jgi:peptidoglycan/LPS O-acetylase OafA/YrhL
MIGVLGIIIIEIQNSQTIKDIFKHTFFGLLYASWIMFVISNSNSSVLNKFLQNSLLQYLGKISYGIYVWHVIAINLVENYIGRSAIEGFFITLCVTILVSILSYNFIEMPFLKLK